MRKNNLFSALQNVMWLTQVGLSVAAPLVLLLLLAVWLVGRGVGEWVFIPALILGIGGGVSAFVSFAGHFTHVMRGSNTPHDTAPDTNVKTEQTHENTKDHLA